MSLKKEMVLAIIFGALLGVLAALFITRIPQKLLSKPETPVPQAEVVTQETPSPQKNEKVLEILLPEDQALVSENKIVVSGKTTPKATVALTGSLNEQVAVASDDGSFSAEISLEEGANEIVVVSIANGEEVEKSLVVNYSKEEI